MRNFFNNLSDFKDDMNRKIKDNKLMFFILLIIYAAGLLTGIFLKKSSTVNIYYIEYSENYYYRIFSESESVFSLLFLRIINNLLFFSVTVLVSLTIYIMPLHFIIIFYRGFILGVVCVIIFTTYSINGIFLTILVVFPQNLITTFFLAVAIITGTGHAGIFTRQRCFSGFKPFIISILTLYLLSLIGAVYELIIISFVFRPLNFLF